MTAAVEAIEVAVGFNRVEFTAGRHHESRRAEIGSADLPPLAIGWVGDEQTTVVFHGIEPAVEDSPGARREYLLSFPRCDVQKS